MSGPSAAGSAGGQAAVREVIARLDRTLAASSVRVELRYGSKDPPLVLDVPPAPADYEPGLVERLVSRGARRAWEHAVPEKWRVWWREMEASLVTAGFAEPAAGRYQLSDGKRATICAGGEHYTAAPGRPLPEGRQDAAAARPQNDPLALLRLLGGVTAARYTGEETLRGTPCRTVVLGKVVRERRLARLPAVSEEADNPAEFTAWIDEHHIRQIETDAFSSKYSSVTDILELWDFGVPVDSLDWTRFPGRPGLS